MFSIFGDLLGFSAIKSDDTRDKVGAHFEKIGNGLTDTKNKLSILSGEISEVKNVDMSTIKTVISNSINVITKLFNSVSKLASVAKEGGSIPIGDNGTEAAKSADKISVDAVIAEVKAIIETATSSDVQIETGRSSGAKVAAGANTALDALVGTAAAGAGDKLAAEVAKADPWAMIDKIKSAKAVAVGAEVASVKTVIEEVKAIIDVADKSGVKVKAGNAGVQVAGGAATAGAALVGKADAAAPAAGAGSKLADEVTKADLWAMIDKIKNAKFEGALAVGDNNEAGALAVGIAGNGGDNHNGAKTNADLVAAVALKAMTKCGKFSAANDDAEAVKVAAASAVNKVLGVLDFIIRKTVAINLDKVGKAVKGIKYSETTIETTEATTIQPAAAK
ncbi:variable large family protein [Borrelia venezuelensis]|uniref:variable large family protein n=1 Tax=Borrelia venezuelensis TaxID=1653839 RepID=UPI003D9B222E